MNRQTLALHTLALATGQNRPEAELDLLSEWIRENKWTFSEVDEPGDVLTMFDMR